MTGRTTPCNLYYPGLSVFHPVNYVTLISALTAKPETTQSSAPSLTNVERCPQKQVPNEVSENHENILVKIVNVKPNGKMKDTRKLQWKPSW